MRDERAHKGVARRHPALSVRSTRRGGPCLRTAPLAYTLRAPTNMIRRFGLVMVSIGVFTSARGALTLEQRALRRHRQGHRSRSAVNRTPRHLSVSVSEGVRSLLLSDFAFIPQTNIT